MTKHSLRLLVEIIIIFFLLAGVLFVIVPVYTKTYAQLCEVRDSAIQILQDETGLKLTYDYMSPSIFKKIKLRNVKIIDSFSGVELLEVRDFSVYYDIVQLASGKPWTAFKNISLDGGKIFWSKIKNKTLAESFSKKASIAEVSASDKDENINENLNNPTENSINTEVSFNTEKLAKLFNLADFSSGVTISLKHISAVYETEKNDFSISIGKANGQITTNGIDLDLNGSLKMDSKGKSSSSSFLSDFNLSGRIDSTFNEGTANLVFNKIKFPDFEINKISFLGAYSNKIIELRTIQNLLPMDLSLVINLEEKSLDASFVAEKIAPFDLVAIKNSKSPLKKFTSVLLSGKMNLHLEQLSKPNYDCSISVFFPEEVIKGSANAKISFVGNKDAIFVRTLSFSSAPIDLDFDGNLFFPSPNSKNVSSLPIIPEGVLTISRFSLPSGFESSAEIFLERRNNGCYFFVPEVLLGSGSFSAIECNILPQKDSIDLSLSMMNFDGLEYGLSGLVSFDVSYATGKDSFLQCYAGIDSLSVGAITNILSEFVSPSVRKNLQDNELLNNLAITTELYATSDMETLAYNVTRLVVASVKDDSLYGLFSISGNESRVDIEKIDISTKIAKISGDIHAEKNGDLDYIFSTDFQINEFPYSVSGMFQNGNTLSVFGDYGFYVSATVKNDNSIDGSVLFDDLPIPISPYYLTFSFDSNFTYSDFRDWYVTINSFNFQEDSGNLPVKPSFASNGAADPSGIYLQTMNYGDSLSMLHGSSSVTWNFDDLVRFIKLETSLVSENTNESYQIDVSISNPEDGDFFSPQNMYFSGLVSLNSLPFGRFLQGQSEANTLSAGITLTGNLENLFLNIDCSQFSVKVGDKMLNADGILSIEDSILSINNLNFSFAEHNINNFMGNLSFKNGIANLNGDYSGKISANFFKAKVDINLNPFEQRSSDITTTTLFTDISQTFESLIKGFDSNVVFSKIMMKEKTVESDLILEVLRKPGETKIYAGKNHEVSCFIYDDLKIVASGKQTCPIAFDLSGSLEKEHFLLDVKNVNLDLNKCWPYLGLDDLIFDSGVIVGDFTISGYQIDPEFNGELLALGAVLRLPNFIGETLGPFDMTAKASGSRIDFGPVIISTSQTFSDVWFEMDMTFDRWLFDEINISTNTMNNQQIMGAVNLLDIMKIEGLVSANLQMKVHPKRMDLTGKLNLDKGSVCLSKFDFSNTSDDDFKFACNLDVSVGQHVEFIYPNVRVPIIRALLNTSDDFRLIVDGEKNSYSVKADADIKGGEIFYFNRNFYIRSGRIYINANQDIFDPIITFRAEVRERDDDENVRIILSADNQRLSSFVPKISSEPSRSEAEILALLGQITMTDVFGNSEDNSTFSIKRILVSATDVLAQLGITRRLEYTLRNILHLDLFSIRTMLLQNAILLSDSQDEVKIGNYLDNTTVYIGKYFGSNIYLDGMFHLYYDDSVPTENIWGGLKMQLETGMELETPFFNMRWKFAPQIDSFKSNLGVADTSVSLVWRFTY